jgi:hypothetical protein
MLWVFWEGVCVLVHLNMFIWGCLMFLHVWMSLCVYVFKYAFLINWYESPYFDLWVFMRKWALPHVCFRHCDCFQYLELNVFWFLVKMGFGMKFHNNWFSMIECCFAWVLSSPIPCELGKHIFGRVRHQLISLEVLELLLRFEENTVNSSRFLCIFCRILQGNRLPLFG